MPVVRLFLRLLLTFTFPVLVAIGTYRFAQSAFFHPAEAGNAAVELFEIQPGTEFREICKQLAERGLVRYWWSIELLTRLGKKTSTIQAGEYELTRSMTPREVLSKLLSGEVYKRSLTVDAGMTIWDVAKAAEKAGLVTEAAFVSAATNANLLARAGISSNSFEGYLFPGTYSFARPIEPERIIWSLLEAGERHWAANPDFNERAEKLILSRHEILTLASIIEKESLNPQEHPVISSVLHNRLSHGMKLQSDATVIYGLTNFQGTLTNEQRESRHPYNTYQNYGLPPGPIANPGELALRAAFYPAQTTYLFFLADGQGGHVFSTTLVEHNEARLRLERLKELEKQPAELLPAQ